MVKSPFAKLPADLRQRVESRPRAFEGWWSTRELAELLYVTPGAVLVQVCRGQITPQKSTPTNYFSDEEVVRYLLRPRTVGRPPKMKSAVVAVALAMAVGMAGCGPSVSKDDIKVLKEYTELQREIQESLKPTESSRLDAEAIDWTREHFPDTEQLQKAICAALLKKIHLAQTESDLAGSKWYHGALYGKTPEQVIADCEREKW